MSQFESTKRKAEDQEEVSKKAKKVEEVVDEEVEDSSLVEYLAQVIYAKNCPTTFYCIFQLVWVPMTTTQNIRVCFLSSRKHFFHKGPPFEFI